VPRDSIEAAAWLRSAAEGGSTIGQWLLSLALESGDGVEVDLAEAFRWSSLAAKGWLVAASTHGELTKKLLAHAQDLLVRTDDREVTSGYELLRLVAEHGSVRAQHQLALALLNGKQRDEAQGTKWLLASADAGFAASQYLIALVLQGISPEQQRRWLIRAAMQGHTLAQYRLGVLLAGSEQKQELVEAYCWIQLAIRGDLERAYFEKAREILNYLESHITDADRRFVLSALQEWKPRDEILERILRPISPVE
jgi:uncharacterized protein